MLNFTRQERLVLAVLGLIFLFGSILHFVFKDQTFQQALQIIDSDKIYPKTDLNRAGYEEFLRLPGIGPASAQRLIDYRNEHGAFRSLDEIRLVPGMGSAHYSKLVKYFKIGKKGRP